MGKFSELDIMIGEIKSHYEDQVKWANHKLVTHTSNVELWYIMANDNPDTLFCSREGKPCFAASVIDNVIVLDYATAHETAERLNSIYDFDVRVVDEYELARLTLANASNQLINLMDE